MRQRKGDRRIVRSVFYMAVYVLFMIMLFPRVSVNAAQKISGTFGMNGGLQWQYDAETKTVTITGEDEWMVYSEEESATITTIPIDYWKSLGVEEIKCVDCKAEGIMNGA